MKYKDMTITQLMAYKEVTQELLRHWSNGHDINTWKAVLDSVYVSASNELARRIHEEVQEYGT